MEGSTWAGEWLGERGARYVQKGDQMSTGVDPAARVACEDTKVDECSTGSWFRTVEGCKGKEGDITRGLCGQ